MHVGREGPQRRRRRQGDRRCDPWAHSAGHNRRCAALTHSLASSVGGALCRALAGRVQRGGPRRGARRRRWRSRATRRPVRSGKRWAARRSVHGRRLCRCLHAFEPRRADPGAVAGRVRAHEDRGRWAAGSADTAVPGRAPPRVPTPPPSARCSLWFATPRPLPRACAGYARPIRGRLPARFEVRKGESHPRAVLPSFFQLTTVERVYDTGNTRTRAVILSFCTMKARRNSSETVSPGERKSSNPRGTLGSSLVIPFQISIEIFFRNRGRQSACFPPGSKRKKRGRNIFRTELRNE